MKELYPNKHLQDTDIHWLLSHHS